MNRPTLVVSTLLLILTIAGVIAFRQLMQPVEKEIDIGWGAEANRNPMLAAMRLLEARNTEVTRVQKLEGEFDSQELDTLFLSEQVRVLSDQQLTQIKTWIATGGHLIQSVSLDHKNSSLVTWLRAEIDETTEEPESLDALQFDYLTSRLMENQDPDRFTLLSFDGLEYQMLAHFYDAPVIQWPLTYDDDISSPEAFYWANDGAGDIHFIQYHWGEGIITLMTDTSVFESDQIDDHDHALLWLQLATDGGKMLIVSGNAIKPLWQILWFYLPEFIALGLVALLLYLRAKTQRFGAVLSPQNFSRRSLSEHLSATALFYWRNKQQQRLLQPLRDKIMLQARIRDRQFEVYSQSQQIELLAASAPYTHQQLRFALFETEPMKERAFLESVRLLKQLQETL